MTVPEVTLTHLNRADGSATYTHHGYSIIGAVNGPIEVARRDEMPEEATLEVNVRPAVGVGSPRERHLETLVHNTLRSIVLTRSIPRTLVQITLQVRSLPEEEASVGVNTNLTILPHLLHTSLLALLSASIPLATTLTSVLIAIPTTQPFLPWPTANQLVRAKPIQSVHVFAFSPTKRLLMSESDGAFSYEEWEEACEMAQDLCCAEQAAGGIQLTSQMSTEEERDNLNLDQWLREVVRKKVKYEQQWKKAT